MSAPHPRTKLRVWLALMVLPALLPLPAMLMRASVGPHWVHPNYEFGYTDLMNAVQIVKGQPPGSFLHPGTPVQIIGAAMLRCRQEWQNSLPLEDAIVRNPESYLRWFQRVLFALVVGGAFLLGVAVYRLTGSLSTACFCQLLSFTSATAWRHVILVGSEPLLLALALVLGALVLCHLYTAPRLVWLWPVAFGAVVGVGLATKFTFAPFAVVPLVILPGWRSKRYFVLIAAAAFVLATMPIWSVYPALFRWAQDLVMHRGYYGSGETGFDLQEYLKNLYDLACKEPAFAATVLVLGIYLVLRLVCWRKWPTAEVPSKQQLLEYHAALCRFPLNPPRTPAASKYLFATLGAMAGQFLMVARHSLPRYLMPAYGLTGVAVALLLFDLARPLRSARAVRALVLAGGTALLIWGGVSFQSLATNYETLRIQAESAVALTSAPNSAVILYYGASDPRYALFYTNYWSNHVCAAAAGRVYPNVYFYDWGVKRYATITGEAVKQEEIFCPGRSVYLHGLPFIYVPALPPAGVVLTALLPEAKQNETVYACHLLGATPARP